MGVALLAVALGPVVLAVVAVVAIVVHGRIAARAVERARREDLPRLVGASGHTLSSLLGAAWPRLRRAAVPAAVAEDQAANGAAAGGEGAAR